MKTFNVNDQKIGPAEAAQQREALISLRNESLTQGRFDWSVILSEIIATQFLMASEFCGEAWLKEVEALRK